MSKSEQIINFGAVDPFAAGAESNQVKGSQASGGNSTGTQQYIHLRIQQRNGRKTLTTVQGLPAELDQKKLLKAFKKVRSGAMIDAHLSVGFRM
jgi:translation initiation factor 1